MISRRICRLPGRNIRLAAQRCYSSSYRDNDRNSSSSSSSSSNGSSNGSSSSSSSKSNERNDQVPANTVRERLSFMPVVNMPEAEFAHNAFFSLHRPLLGLSSDEERPFFSTATRHHGSNELQKMLGLDQAVDDMEDSYDDALTQYMMELRPFEPPHSPDSEAVEEKEAMVTLSFEDGHSAYEEIEAIHMDQSMPMYYMPESDEVVDYLTAMQDKLQQRHEQEREENGRRRGSNRPLVHAATAAEARKRTMSIQQYRQRTRRQRPIAMLDRKHHK